MAKRLLVIGIDGGTWRVLDRLLEEHRLPVLQGLIQTGLKNDLISTIPPITAAAWSSFQTGVHPGKHGVYDFIALDVQNKRAVLVNSRAIQAPTLWELLSRAGKQAVVINVPLTFPPRRLPGIVTIGGMLSPEVSPKFVHPPEVYDRVIRKVHYRILVPRWAVKSLKPAEFVDEEIEVEHERFRAAHLLLDLYPDWSFFMIHVQSSDVIQHAFWHYLDPSWPQYTPEAWRTITRFYEALDQEIGRLVDHARPDAVLIISDHGFGPARTEVNLNLWLKRRGLLKTTGTDKLALLEDFTRRVDRWNLIKRLAVKLLGHNAARKLRGRKAGNIFQKIDWEHTRLFVTASIHFAFLFLNPRFRREEVLPPLETALQELRYRDGSPIVQRVHFKEDLYGPEPRGYPPDLIVEPREGFVFSSNLDAVGLFRSYRPGLEDTGAHAMEGIVVASGAGFQGIAGGPFHIVDIAPTVLQFLGLPVPEHMDGRPINGRGQAGKPPTAPGPTGETPPESVYTPEEEREIQKRLEDLGYL